MGHLICAQEARWALGLDVVRLVPVGRAPHRVLDDDPGAHARALMCELAGAGDPALEVSRVELERDGPSYTADTLRLMRRAAPDEELTVILGADQAARLPSWREPEVVLELARVAVAERGGGGREAVREACAGLAGAERIAFFDMPRVDVASSEVRRRAASGRPIRYLVADKVRDLIADQGLYGATRAVAAE